MPLRRVTGLHACKEALKSAKPGDIKRLFLKPDWQKSPPLRELARRAVAKGLKPEILSLKKLNRITPAHQGLCLELSGQVRFSVAGLGPYSALLLLDGVQDPKNLGAIVRSAWLMGADGVFLSQRNSAGLSPFTAKAASGGLEHVPVESLPLKHHAQQLKRKGFWLYALAPDSPHSLWRENLAKRSAFVLGGEHKGIRQSLKALCDKSLCVPQKTQSANYNVSVAAGLVLAEHFRQISLAQFPSKALAEKA